MGKTDINVALIHGSHHTALAAVGLFQSTSGATGVLFP
jgi:hypothetical protein